MYDIIIVGAGIAGLNTARLLDKSNKKICIIEKTNRIGGLIDSKYISVKYNNKVNKVKIETGGAVVYGYQKNMLHLVKKFNIDLQSMPLDSKKRHNKKFLDINKKRPLSRKYVDKYFNLIKKIFNYMDKKGQVYCRKFTLEQIALEVISFKDIRFVEFCYGYVGEIRGANSVVSRKNIENELFYSDTINFFKGDGYIELIRAIYNTFSKDITLKKNVNYNHLLKKIK